MSLTVTYCCWLSLNSMELGEKLRESQQKLETVKDMQTLHSTRRESERQPASIGDSERDAESPWN